MHAAQTAAEPWNDDGEHTEIGLRSAHAEIGAALRVTDSVAAARLETARALISDLPAVQAALAGGDISLWHANAIVDATRSLPPDKARIVADRVLCRAPGGRPCSSCAAACAARYSPPTRTVRPTGSAKPMPTGV